MSLLQISAVLGSIAATAYAHGHVTGIVVDGTYYTGYDPSFQYQATPPSVIGWSDPEDLGNGFIAPSAFGTDDIICHLGATPGKSVAKVAAGGKVSLQWSPWPESHHGPVLDYLAKCAGDDCTTVTKTDLEFFKIGEAGLLDDSAVPGKWASDTLIANNNTWDVTIPESIAPGQYVLRHEIIALHSAGQADGAQNYPQCINIEVTGSGTATPAGVVGTKIYTDPAAPGIVVNIYQALSSYVIPGPALWTGAASGSQSAAPTASSSAAAAPASSAASSAAESYAAPSTTAPAATSAAAATSAVSPTESYEAPATTTAAPATTASPAYGATVTTTNVAIVTAETTVTASGYDSTPTSAPAAAISHIASALPSSVLTATISTALPSAASYGNSQASGSAAPGYPSKPLPEGFTLKDLLEWVSYLLSKSFSEAGVHARDFAARRH